MRRQDAGTEYRPRSMPSGPSVRLVFLHGQYGRPWRVALGRSFDSITEGAAVWHQVARKEVRFVRATNRRTHAGQRRRQASRALHWGVRFDDACRSAAPSNEQGVLPCVRPGHRLAGARPAAVPSLQARSRQVVTGPARGADQAETRWCHGANSPDRGRRLRRNSGCPPGQ
jgi:hypothetical protein